MGWFKKEEENFKECAERLAGPYRELRDNLKEEIANLREDLHIHRKLSGVPEMLVLNVPKSSFCNNQRLHKDEYEAYTQEERNKLTERGFSFFHTKVNGDEIWVKKPVA